MVVEAAAAVIPNDVKLLRDGKYFIAGTQAGLVVWMKRREKRIGMHHDRHDGALQRT